MASHESITRLILRTVLVIVAVVAVLGLLWLLRRPLGWIVIAGFLAVALSGPVNLLSRRMPRGAAIGVTYLGVLLIPVAIVAIVVPPLVRELTQLVDEIPRYATEVRDFVNDNQTLRNLDEEYGIFETLEEEARELPGRIGDAADALRDLGVSAVNSVFAGFTILILSIFLVADGRRWVRGLIALQEPASAERVQRMVDRMGVAVGNYVLGAALQATVAGLTTFLVLLVLGTPFAAPLAVLFALFDLIPLVGATIAAILVGLVTVFEDFPRDTLIWAAWAILYQQVENNVIQPQIQRRAVDIHPFAVLVSVLFGATLFGVVGALLAIPAAASVQIAVREWWQWRREAEGDPEAAI
jgi:predicted PurR-regulated permease PerM